MVTRVKSFPRSVNLIVPRLVCSMAHPSPLAEVTAMLNVTRSLSHGTTIAFKLPRPVAYCSIACETARGAPVAVNSRISLVMANYDSLAQRVCLLEKKVYHSLPGSVKRGAHG